MHETAILNIANRLYGGAVTDRAGACRLMADETVEAWMIEGSVPLRFMAINWLGDRVLTVVFKRLGTEGISVISMRPASRKEREL